MYTSLEIIRYHLLSRRRRYHVPSPRVVHFSCPALVHFYMPIDTPGPEVVRDDQRRDAFEVLESPDMEADPVADRLGPGRLGVGVARGPQHSHEHLGLARCARLAVDDADCAAGIIDEHPLPGLVVLPHPDRPPARPLAVKIAVPAVLVSQGMGLLVLVPEEEERHALPPELARDLRPVGKRPVHRSDERRRREEPPLQNEVIAVGRQRWPEVGNMKALQHRNA